MTTFCWFPPERDAAGVCGLPPRTSNSFRSRAARCDETPRVEPAPLRVRLLPEVVQGEVLGEREVEDEPADLAVLGNVPDSRVEALAGARGRHVLAADGDLARPPASGGR